MESGMFMIGLPNTGNNCWLNATLQALCGIGRFVDSLEAISSSNVNDMLTIELAKTVLNMESNLRISSMNKLLMLCTSNFKFRMGQQHDASEFLIMLMNHICDKLEKAQNHQLLTDFKTSFEMQIRNRNQCMYMRHMMSELDQGFYVIPISYEDWGSVWDSIQDFFAEEIIANCPLACEANKHVNECASVECESCKRRVGVTIEKEIQSLPNVLILQLQIFQLIEGRSSSTEKQLNYDTMFTQSLDLLARFCNVSSTDTYRKYQLKSVILHQGQSSFCGHYNAISIRNKKWYYFNDDESPRFLEDPSRFLITHNHLHPYVLIYVDCSGADEVFDLAGKRTIVKSMSRISLKDLDEDGRISIFYIWICSIYFSHFQYIFEEDVFDLNELSAISIDESEQNG
jgi:ubiquitin C-terminal hydrolase